MSELYHLTLRSDAGECPVFVGAGALRQVESELTAWSRRRTVFVLSSHPLHDIQAGLVETLSVEAAAVKSIWVPDGESAKTLEVAGETWREMLRQGGKRDSRLVAIGGGTVGDLGGFVAACFLRGIEFVQIPTTLLAQVDASVGGKTAIDLPEGKNTVGAFHHPALVVSDTELLSSLDRAELRSGLVEVIKMAALLDPQQLDRVENQLEPLLAGDAEALAPVVADAAQTKIDVVQEDPLEKNRRRLLNFGHTLGHALEVALGYAGLRHGEAVAYGMLFAMRLARTRSFPAADETRLRALLARLELPALPVVDVNAVMSAMQRDKKAREGSLSWVLPTRIGGAEIVDGLSLSKVESELRAFLLASDPT